jgi:hypothetical protein
VLASSCIEKEQANDAGDVVMWGVISYHKIEIIHGYLRRIFPSSNASAESWKCSRAGGENASGRHLEMVVIQLLGLTW